MKVKCQVCGIEGQLQHLSKNYFRVKHYLGSVDGKLKFEYHKQSLQYVQRLLNNSNLRPIDPIDQKDIDLKVNNSGSVSQMQVGWSSSLVRTDLNGDVSRNSLFF